MWRLVADMSPEELVRCIDFRYITDCITPAEALTLLRERARGKAERLALLEADGWGRIVNIASVHGLVGSVGKAAYVAAKHGV